MNDNEITDEQLQAGELTPMEIEREKEELLKISKLYNALVELEKNEHWQLLIKDYFMKERVLNINSLLAVENQKADRGNNMEELVAISNFGEFLRLLEIQFINAFGSMDSSEAVRQAESK